MRRDIVFANGGNSFNAGERPDSQSGRAEEQSDYKFLFYHISDMHAYIMSWSMTTQPELKFLLLDILRFLTNFAPMEPVGWLEGTYSGAKIVIEMTWPTLRILLFLNAGDVSQVLFHQLTHVLT